MLRRSALSAALVTALVLSIAPASSSAAAPSFSASVQQGDRPERPRDLKPESRIDPDTVLVKFDRGMSEAAKERAAARRGAKRVAKAPELGYELLKARGKAKDMVRSFQGDPQVEEVSPNYIRKIAATPNDPAYSQGYQNYLKTLRLPEAWNRVRDARTQVIAVVDTGVDGSHDDLSGRLVAGYNAINPGSSSKDDNGHGTMVAGVAAAGTSNGMGVAGAAWLGRIMPIKVLNSDGAGEDWHIVNGIRWAAGHGAKVINLSLGGFEDNPALRDAVAYATGKGALVVAAAGNFGADIPVYPAAYPQVLAVGATDEGARLTDFSSWGDWVDVAAPGFDIVGPWLNDEYYILAGTSFSAPLVSGIAALVRTKYRDASPADIHSRLRKTARDVGPRGIDPYYGWGFVDAYHAVGGDRGADFAQPSMGPGEPNDVAARATVFSGSVTGTMANAGDADWFRFESTEARTIQIQVSPAAFVPERAQNFDPMLAVYDSELRLLGDADLGPAGELEKVTVTVGAGPTYVKVSNFNGSPDTRSYTVSVQNAAAAMFDPATSTSVGSWPETVAIGDVTGDGRNDVVMATEYYFDEANDYKLFVFAQQPDGSLAAPVKYGTALAYSDRAGLALLDADGDQKLDVALATTAGLEIFPQNATGTLGASSVVPGTSGARQVIAADMNGDGADDLVATATDGIVQAIQQPGGAFDVSVVGTAGPEIEAGDVDGDGRTDVVTFASGLVRIYHRTDTGWQQTEHDTIRGYWPNIEGIEVADVSGDGRLDITATIGGNAPGSRVNVFVQQSDGSLAAPAVYLTRDIPEPVEAGDFDSDSRLDVVAAHGGWNAVSVLPQKTDGTLATPITTGIPYASHYNTQGLAVGDVNGDGRVDVAIADYNHGLVVLRNSSSLTPAGEQEWVSSASPADFATGRSTGEKPTVKFARDVDAASVTSSTVRLLHGRTGSAVSALVSYDADVRTATITPTSALSENTPYRISVNGVTQAGETMTWPFSTTFQTVNYAPPKPQKVAARGYYKKATVTWSQPQIPDLRRVVVRMAEGTTAPSSPGSGTSVYSGAGTSVTATGLTPGKSYSFRVWVQDRADKYSEPLSKVLRGTTLSTSASPSKVSSGGTVKISGKLLTTAGDNPIAGKTVAVYTRKKGTSTWYKVGTKTTSSTGYYAISHSTTVAREYQARFLGSSAHMGRYSAIRTVSIG